MQRKYVRVKICGIKDHLTAYQAVIAGADAIGFVFAPSPRRISQDKAQEIICRLPPFVSKVGVFANQGLQEILDIAETAGLDTIQLHGEETADFCNNIKPYYSVIKSFKGEADYNTFSDYNVDAYLLDTEDEGKFGGTGKTFDWRTAANCSKKPLILAGGLNPENVQKAICIVNPYAVDVSSGVEVNGFKDFSKMKEFVRRVKG